MTRDASEQPSDRELDALRRELAAFPAERRPRARMIVRSLELGRLDPAWEAVRGGLELEPRDGPLLSVGDALLDAGGSPFTLVPVEQPERAHGLLQPLRRRGPRTTIGRASDHGVCLDFPGVGRLQCTIWCRGGAHFQIEHSGTGNPTYVNGIAIPWPTRDETHADLRDGDRIVPGQRGLVLAFRLGWDGVPWPEPRFLSDLLARVTSLLEAPERP